MYFVLLKQSLSIKAELEKCLFVCLFFTQEANQISHNLLMYKRTPFTFKFIPPPTEF